MPFRNFAPANQSPGLLSVIFDTVLVATVPNVDITGIPQTYRNLQLIVRGQSAKAAALFDDLRLVLNGDVGASYDYQELKAITAAVTAAKASGQTSGLAGILGGAGSSHGISYVDLPDYAEASLPQSWLFRCFVDDLTTPMTLKDGGGRWAGVGAINRITLSAGGGNLVAGSRVQLLGL